MYLIFRGKIFLGFTDDKKIMKAFKNERTGYRIEKVKDLSGDIFELDQFSFNARELIYYPLYKRHLFGYECTKLTEVIMHHLIRLQSATAIIKAQGSYIKYTDEEMVDIVQFVKFVDRLVEDLNHEETCVTLSDYFDIEAILDIITSENPTIQ